MARGDTAKGEMAKGERERGERERGDTVMLLTNEFTQFTLKPA